MKGGAREEYLVQTCEGVRLRLRVAPRASRDRLEGIHNGALKLRLTAPPVEGTANKAIVAFLSKLLKVPKSSIIIESGLKSRDKCVLISGARSSDVERALEAALK